MAALGLATLVEVDMMVGRVEIVLIAMEVDELLYLKVTVL